MKAIKVEWLEEAASTNALMRERLLSASPPPTGTVLATTNQTAGRGRGDRVWLSGEGKNLCFSLYMATDAPALDIPSLTMAAALAVAGMLREMGVAANTKWPNDVRVDGHKICGILSEHFSAGKAKGAIVGIGINVNMTREDAKRIDQPATSIAIKTGNEVNPFDVLERLKPFLVQMIAKWKQDGFAAIRPLWMARCEGVGGRVELAEKGHVAAGVLAGFGEHGELILRFDNGDTVDFWSGDLRLS